MDYQAEPGLAPTERLRNIVSFLETGDAARAGIELDAYEGEGGDPETTAYWQKQIRGDPDSFFEADGTTHSVREGESLSSISRLFLGDPLQFYLLARFNGIDNPSRIEAGQVIRIPKPRTTPLAPQADAVAGAGPAGDTAAAAHTANQPQDTVPTETAAVADGADRAPESGASSETSPRPPVPTEFDQPAETVVAPEPRPRETQSRIKDAPDTPPEAFDEAAERAGQGELESAIVLLEDGLKRYPGNQKVRRAAVLAYAKHSEALLADGKPEQAAVTLAKAADLDPENTEITTRLHEVRNRLQAEAFYEKGLGLRDGGDAQSAMAAFGKALEIAPDYTDAQVQFESLQVQVVGQLQRDAIEALRQEDYDTALTLWQRVLEIDPANGTADRYHNHTLELLGREPAPESE